MNNQNDHAAVRVHPPFLMVLNLILAFVLQWLLPLPLPASQWVRVLGFLIVVAGLGLAFSAVREFRSAGTTVDPHGSVAAVVTSGPYRFTRNPIYLGFACVVAGIPLALGIYWGVLIVPLMLILFEWLVVRREEEYLAAKFGSDYQGYRSRVRRWL